MKIQPIRRVESNSSLRWKRAAVTSFKNAINEDDKTEKNKKLSLFSSYCQNSSIHGMKYLAEQRRPRCERIFWLIVFGISILLFVPLADDLWMKWILSDKFVSFTDKSIYVWEIPFPTVTACSATITTAFNFHNVYQKALNFKRNKTSEPLTDDEMVNLDTTLLIFKEDYAKNVDGYSRLNAGDQMQVFEEVMPKLNEIFKTCRWRNTEENCEHLFTKTITAAGICYSFNALSFQDTYRSGSLKEDHVISTQDHGITNWNLEDGYITNLNNEVYPRRAMDAKDELELVLGDATNSAYYNQLRYGPVDGLMILINTPGKVPQVTEKYTAVYNGQEAIFNIKPKIVTASESLKYSNVYVRQCLFQNERYLRYFKTYTQSNCELECLSNFTLRTCGCVRFSMPCHPGVPACGSRLIECMTDAEDSILRDCECFPTCASISYQTEKISNHFQSHQKSVKKTNIHTNETSRKTSFRIHFKDSQYPTTKVVNLYGLTDFLADCGGVLSILMGCSVISFVEVIYFLTLRLITNYRGTNKTKTEGIKDA